VPLQVLAEQVLQCLPDMVLTRGMGGLSRCLWQQLTRMAEGTPGVTRREGYDSGSAWWERIQTRTSCYVGPLS
jgi:hypothetical protein